MAPQAPTTCYSSATVPRGRDVTADEVRQWGGEFDGRSVFPLGRHNLDAGWKTRRRFPDWSHGGRQARKGCKG
jgi:hypothetical protein